MLRRTALVVIAVIVCEGSALAPPRQPRGPRIEILEPEARYFVEEGAVVTHTFRIRNIGDEPLEINDVKCTDCEVVGPDGRRLKLGPGRKHLLVSWEEP